MAPKIIVGMMGSSVAEGSSSLATPAQVSSFLNLVKKHSFVTELDTARVYNAGKSEELLGAVPESRGFKIATKAPAFSPGSLAEQNILTNAEKSFKALKIEKVDIYYLHGPDRSTPLEEQCRAINTVYQQGHFDRFGVSNITGKEVQEMHDICARNGWVKPTVYQGVYNPLMRSSEETLFPVLKTLGMNFYAYSPLAGGMLAKPLDKITNPDKGTRFAAMKVFGDLFLKEPIIKALGDLQTVCDAEEIPLVEATMRWFVHHSPLSEEDGCIVGASTESQIEKSLAACEKPPLPDKVAQAFEDMWLAIKSGTTGSSI